MIKSKNFILRHVKLSDAENIYAYQQDKDTLRNFMTVPKSIREVEKEIKEKIRRKKKKLFGESFVIDVDGEVIGKVSFRQMDPYNKTKAKITYWIAKKYRGRGIMTEAVKLITQYAFKKYKLVRIQGNVRTFNKASAKVLEKAGYKLEGILRKNNYRDGKYLDDIVFAKVR